MDAKGEILITIMASIAQQESASIPQNVRMGWQYTFQQGRGALNITNFLGLKKGAERRAYEIDPDTAPIIRRIFREYLEGFNPTVIAKSLERDGIPSPAGKPNWQPATVRSILENEKYSGDLLCQKYYVKDFLTHKLTKNEGALPQYYMEDHHPAIIPKKVFFQTQGEIMRRAKTKTTHGKTRTFTDVLFCPICGKPLNRVAKRGKVDWRCSSKEGEGKTSLKDRHSNCGCRFVTEDEAKAAVVAALNQLPMQRVVLMQRLGAIQTGELKRVDALIGKSKLQEEEVSSRLAAMTDQIGDEAVYLTQQIEKLHEERDQLILERAVYANEELEVRLFLEFIDEMMGRSSRIIDDGSACTDYDDFFHRTAKSWDFVVRFGKVLRFTDDMVTRFVKKIIVTEEGLEVEFKAGVKVVSMRVAA